MSTERLRSQSKEERRERAARAEARRAAWRESEAASAELDWARYGKYDALQELLRVALADRDAQVRAAACCGTCVCAVLMRASCGARSACFTGCSPLPLIAGAVHGAKTRWPPIRFAEPVEVLTAPQEEARYSPVRVAMGMVPERGVAKYDALRQLLRGMLTADASAPEHDLVWDLLHSYRAKTESGVCPIRYPAQASSGAHARVQHRIPLRSLCHLQHMP